MEPAVFGLILRSLFTVMCFLSFIIVMEHISCNADEPAVAAQHLECASKTERVVEKLAAPSVLSQAKSTTRPCPSLTARWYPANGSPTGRGSACTPYNAVTTAYTYSSIAKAACPATATPATPPAAHAWWAVWGPCRAAAAAPGAAAKALRALTASCHLHCGTRMPAGRPPTDPPLTFVCRPAPRDCSHVVCGSSSCSCDAFRGSGVRDGREW